MRYPWRLENHTAYYSPQERRTPEFNVTDSLFPGLSLAHGSNARPAATNDSRTSKN